MSDDHQPIRPAAPGRHFRGRGHNMIFGMAPDLELAQVGPGTPCGEYLRRFWQPIALNSMFSALPLRVRRLGEDLILFRDDSGQHLFMCPYSAHRNTSLEYGIIGRNGIRCRSPGLPLGADGTILEPAGEPITTNFRKLDCRGAYPVLQFKGIVFAYFGPAAEVPPFPVFDTMELEDDIMAPLLIPVRCNWVQVFENSIDPFHVTSLNPRLSGVQFQEHLNLRPTVTYHERNAGYFYSSARKIGNLAWFRINEYLLPNFWQNGGLNVEADQPVYFGRPSLTGWIVPIDDNDTLYIAWRHLAVQADPTGKAMPGLHGYNSADFSGHTGAPDYRTRQRSSGDNEAWFGCGEISEHAREIPKLPERGVETFRRGLRSAIRNLRAGIVPPPITSYGQPVPTYGGDTILRMPHTDLDDATLLNWVSHKIAAAYRSGHAIARGDRVAHIKEELRRLEEHDCGLADVSKGG